MNATSDTIPNAVSLKVGFIDQINAVQIAHPIQEGPVRIMAGSNRIDVILLHCDDIFYDIIIGDTTSVIGREFMAVNAMENDTLAV